MYNHYISVWRISIAEADADISCSSCLSAFNVVRFQAVIDDAVRAAPEVKAPFNTKHCGLS